MTTMNWDDMLPQHNCKRCGRPLNADGGHPAELYAGTYTGLCYACEREGPRVVKAYGADGAQRISYPPSCPSWRRDREEYIAYPDCRECKGTGRIYVDRPWRSGGGYYKSCDRCLGRFSGHPGRKRASARSTALYEGAAACWNEQLRAIGLHGQLLVVQGTGEELPEEVAGLVEDLRQATIGRMRELQERLVAVATSRGYW